MTERARPEPLADRQALPEAAWEAIFAEHERDHQHADARREGCNGCAMLQYAETLRAQLSAAEEAAHSALDLLEAERAQGQTLREEIKATIGERERAYADCATLHREKATLKAQHVSMSQDILRVQGEVVALREALSSIVCTDPEDAEIVRAALAPPAPRP